jgi:hypothetical protein
MIDQNSLAQRAAWSVARPRLPLAVKLAYTAFLCVLVPYYLKAYGPTNFLYFCDVALLLTAVTVWTEHPLPASASAVGILLPQTLWMADFLASLAGHPVTGMTGYMFNSSLPVFTRFLSFYHFWLPLFLLWLVRRLGYDRRGFAAWSALAIVLLLVCYLFLPAPPAPANDPGKPVNVNYVFGPSDEHAQTWLPPMSYLLCMMAFLPALIFWPTHLMLRRIGPNTAQVSPPQRVQP